MSLVEQKEKVSEKIWTTVSKHETFEEADKQRTKLQKEKPTALIKVKRGSKCFRVKVWEPEKKKKSTKKNKKVATNFKKGKNNKRVEKNDNKKVRN